MYDDGSEMNMGEDEDSFFLVWGASAAAFRIGGER